MATLFDPAVNARLRERLDGLTAETPRRWGTMDPAQMLRHLDLSFRMALGEHPLPFQGNWLTRVTRGFVIGPMPWSRGLPTAKGLRTSADPAEFAAARAGLGDAWQRFLDSPEDHAFGDHPLFGPMTRREYGKLMAKHVEHHLRQFGR
jgi:hypothetical protein